MSVKSAGTSPAQMFGLQAQSAQLLIVCEGLWPHREASLVSNGELSLVPIKAWSAKNIYQIGSSETLFGYSWGGIGRDLQSKGEGWKLF